MDAKVAIRDLALRAFRLSFGEMDERARALSIYKAVKKSRWADDNDIRFLLRLTYENIETLDAYWYEFNEDDVVKQNVPPSVSYSEIDEEEEMEEGLHITYLPDPVQGMADDRRVDMDKVIKNRKRIRLRKILSVDRDQNGAVALILEGFDWHPVADSIDEECWDIAMNYIEIRESPTHFVDLDYELRMIDKSLFDDVDGKKQMAEWKQALLKHGIKPTLGGLFSAHPLYLKTLIASGSTKEAFEAVLKTSSQAYKVYLREGIKGWIKVKELRGYTKKGLFYLEHPVLPETEFINASLLNWRARKTRLAFRSCQTHPQVRPNLLRR
jgi:hypothetical protein